MTDYTHAEFAVALQRVFGYTLTANQEILESACSCCNDLQNDILGNIVYVYANHPNNADYRGSLIIDSKGIRPWQEFSDEILYPGYPYRDSDRWRSTTSLSVTENDLVELIDPAAVERAVAYIQVNFEKYNAWGK